jgi:hypothetical protein
MDFVTAIADTGRSFHGFYDRDYLDKKDKYGSFLSGNNARVDITRPGEPNRPKLLLIKDSFAHAAVPFLAYHFDIIMLDLRHFIDESVARLVVRENIDRVLFLHNMHNFSEDDTFGILGFGTQAALNSFAEQQRPIRNIFINNNNIREYVIVHPAEPFSRPRREANAAAAERLRDIILERAGVGLEIITTEDFSEFTELDKIIGFTRDGLPGNGFIKIAVEGNNLMLRCNIGNSLESPGYAAGIFIENYLRGATGSFNFGSDFVYSDFSGDFVMIMPRAGE